MYNIPACYTNNNFSLPPYYTIPYDSILYYTIPYDSILYYTILFYTILYYTILYHTILYHTVLYHTIQYYAILNDSILYYTILFYTILNHTILHYTQVKQNMKGHHLREALPPMPAKPTKAFTDHRDPVFIQERYTLCVSATLSIYLSVSVSVSVYVYLYFYLTFICCYHSCCRCQALERYVTDLVAIPHVSSMVCVKAFLGIMDQVGTIPMFP
jgi:hypothetical protein